MNPTPPSQSGSDRPYPAPDGRIEPVGAVGDWDRLRFEDAPQRGVDKHAHNRRRFGLRIGLPLLVLALIALIPLRQPLSDRLWPESRLQALHQQAAQALSEGKLTAPDGQIGRAHV